MINKNTVKFSPWYFVVMMNDKSPFCGKHHIGGQPPQLSNIIWQKCSLGDPSFIRKRGHYFKTTNCTYLVYLCLRKQVGDTIVNGWPVFECNTKVFADRILPYGSHCIDMTSSPEPINGYRHVVVMLCNV